MRPTPAERPTRGPDAGPAYYASGRQGRWRDLRAVLHPPYTAWHLSYVVLGGLIAKTVHWSVLGATVLAFFLAVGISAHALDELRGRPLGTSLPSWVLVAAGAAGLAGAIAIGAAGVTRIGWGLVVFVVVGALLVLGYNLELFGGALHNDASFALAWGAFPVLTAAYAQSGTVTVAAILLAAGTTGLSAAQRSLSTPARTLRRHVTSVTGTVVLDDGTELRLDRATLLEPVERALRLLSWSVVALALSLLAARLMW